MPLAKGRGRRGMGEKTTPQKGVGVRKSQLKAVFVLRGKIVRRKKFGGKGEPRVERGDTGRELSEGGRQSLLRLAKSGRWGGGVCDWFFVKDRHLTRTTDHARERKGGG